MIPTNPQIYVQNPLMELVSHPLEWVGGKKKKEEELAHALLVLDRRPVRYSWPVLSGG